MPIHTDLTIINTTDIAAVLEVAGNVAHDVYAVPMLLAIVFEYSLLMDDDMSPAERDRIRAGTLQEAREQARVFREIVKKGPTEARRPQ